VNAHRTSISARAAALGLDTLGALASRLTIERVLAIGAGAGRLWFRLRGPRTRFAGEQLRLAFPEQDPSWVVQRTEETFTHLGRGLAELILLRSAHRAALLERVEVEGLEHLEVASRASPSGGVLVLSAHLGNWELAAAKVASLGIPTTAIYRGLRSRALDHALMELRAAGGDSQGNFEQVRIGRAGLGVVHALRAGRKVLVLLDQNARRGQGVFVPFFGRLASTRFGPARLASRLGIPVVPAFIRRDEDGVGHRIRVHPSLQLQPGASEDEAALRRNVELMTAAIEAEIREAPAQWIWTHRRWRTRPRSEGLHRPK
jgi:KDO2-lipid IV(A) lauroyltransferase